MSELEDIVRRIVRDELARSQPANDQSAFMSIAEAAAFARMSPGTIRRWVRDGKLTKLGTPARVLVRRDDLERFLARDITPDELSPEERARRRFG